MSGDRDELSILKSVSLTSALERQLEKLIIEGGLAPGERLNEIKLAAHFGTSRGPLREATRSLEAKGFVEAIRNRGVFVRRVSMDEVQEVYELRCALFGLAGKLLAQRITDATLALLSDLVRHMEEASGHGDLDAYYPLNLQFHDTIVSRSGNVTLAKEYHRFVKKMHLFRVKSLVQGGGLAVSNQEHAEILNALAARDADRAFKAHWMHVANAKHRMLAASRMEAGGS